MYIYTHTHIQAFFLSCTWLWEPVANLLILVLPGVVFELEKVMKAIVAVMWSWTFASTLIAFRVARA